MVAAAVDRESLVFVREMGVHTPLGPIYSYALRGKQLHLPVPRNRRKNTTLLSSMTTDGRRPLLAVEGATTAQIFETNKKVLVPSPHAGQIAVMDKLCAYKPKRVRELIEQQGCELLYLPLHSPDHYPIEEASSKIKTRSAQGCSKEQRGFGRSDRPGSLGGKFRRWQGLLRPCWIPSDRSIGVKRAVLWRSGTDHPRKYKRSIVNGVIGVQ
jgi:transposase